MTQQVLHCYMLVGAQEQVYFLWEEILKSFKEISSEYKRILHEIAIQVLGPKEICVLDRLAILCLTICCDLCVRFVNHTIGSVRFSKYLIALPRAVIVLNLWYLCDYLTINIIFECSTAAACFSNMRESKMGVSSWTQLTLLN